MIPFKSKYKLSTSKEFNTMLLSSIVFIIILGYLEVSHLKNTGTPILYIKQQIIIGF